MKEYDYTHDEDGEDFDVVAWCCVHCSPESYAAIVKPGPKNRNLTALEVNDARQAILEHYFATVFCEMSFRRHISIV
eukprot:6999959-Heterocapsa_arctica.AAC.1